MKPFEWPLLPGWQWEKNAHCAGQPEDHHFGLLIMLTVMTVAFLLVLLATEAPFVFLQESPIP
jgi:hypothetical protein